MTNEKPEPVERLEEITFHPADKTFNVLHDKGIATKKELSDERSELNSLLTKMAEIAKKGSKEYAALEKEVQQVKEKVSKKHDELMEILKNEEKISREIQEKKL